MQNVYVRYAVYQNCISPSFGSEVQVFGRGQYGHIVKCVILYFLPYVHSRGR